MPEPICATCKQPIREGERSGHLPFTPKDELYHSDPKDCIAAVARRCAEICEQRAALYQSFSAMSYLAHRKDAAAIRAEFPEAFK